MHYSVRGHTARLTGAFWFIVVDEHDCQVDPIFYDSHDSALIAARELFKKELLDLARTHDKNACWNTDDPDENCLLVAPGMFVIDELLEIGGPSAHEDPNPDGAPNTRVVFPSIPTNETIAALADE